MELNISLYIDLIKTLRDFIYFLWIFPVCSSSKFLFGFINFANLFIVKRLKFNLIFKKRILTDNQDNYNKMLKYKYFKTYILKICNFTIIFDKEEKDMSWY